jgi:hypothetical protein
MRGLPQRRLDAPRKPLTQWLAQRDIVLSAGSNGILQKGIPRGRM